MTQQYIRKKPLPDTAKKDSIIANACEHFNMSEAELLTKRWDCLTTSIVMLAIYKDAHYRHLMASQVFGYTFPQQSFRGMLNIENIVRKNRKDAATVLAFYQKYGHCKYLWEGKNIKPSV